MQFDKHLNRLNFYKAIVQNDKDDKILPNIAIGIGALFFFLLVAGIFIKGAFPTGEGVRLMLVLFAVWGIPTYLTNKQNEKDI